MRLNVEDALTYLDLVKERFEGQGTTYFTFLDVMKNFKAQTIDTTTVINRVRELFKDHPDLIVGFNSFIPEGYKMDGTTPSQPKMASNLDEMSAKAEEIDNNVKIRSPPHNRANPENQEQQYSHALQFANRVKNRFLSSPEVYRNFLKILHWYQNELKDNNPAKRLHAENTVSNDVAKLFEGHNDLLKEFNKFLPESSFMNTESQLNKRNILSTPSKQRGREEMSKSATSAYQKTPDNRLKRSTNYEQSTVHKKSKVADNVRDVSISDFAQIGCSNDLSILHKIHDAFRNETMSYQSYTCLLQNIQLYNNNTIKKETLLESCKPLFGIQHIDLWRQLKDLVMTSRKKEVDKNEVQSMYEKRFDLDFSKLKKCGVSYKILPHDYPNPTCTGRIGCTIAQEVLNDAYISFASLASEDSQFVASKKNQYEESIYRVEDERYEVDMVVELNRVAMEALLSVKHTIENMTREELQNYKIDDCLGGTSAVLMKKAIHRVYGDKANEVIHGLKKCPKTAVGLVINRMRQKEAEWKEAIKSYQRVWTDQDSRNYLKSLDHQGAVFKQKDYPLIRSKNFVNQIESIAYGERSISSPSPNGSDPISSLISGSLHMISEYQSYDISNRLGQNDYAEVNCLANIGPLISPFFRMSHQFSTNYGNTLINVYEGTGRLGSAHLALKFPDPADYCTEILEDATNLIIHHVKRQTNSSKEDKKEMKFLIRSVIQDFFQNEHFPQSDDEDDEEAEKETEVNVDSNKAANSGQDGDEERRNEEEEEEEDNYCNVKYVKKKISPTVHDKNSESYTLFYANNHWYSLIRLYHLLVSRLDLLKRRGEVLALESQKEIPTRMRAAEVLRLRKLSSLEPDKYYTRALGHVKDLLDGAEDITSYEDHLRDMFGIYAYPWFTMDRLIANIVKQLHIVACNDSLSERLTNLFLQWNNKYNLKSSRINQKIKTPVIGISGPIHSRIERLSDEVEYSCDVMHAFANDSNLDLVDLNNKESQVSTTANGNASANNTNSSSTWANNNNSTKDASYQQQMGNDGENVNGKTISNCYPMVIMKNSSLIMLRLIEPFIQHPKDVTSKNGQSESRSFQGLAVILQNQCNAEIKCQKAFKEFSENPETPCKNWLDYIVRYFLNVKSYSASLTTSNSQYSVPIMSALATRIRPVLLFKNVEKCITALTKMAIERKKMQLLSDPTSNQHDPIERMISDEVKSEDDPNADYHKLMMSIFKSALTKEELFRNTLNSDFMQFNQKEKTSAQGSAANNLKSYKINWSVGSYGIFFRRKNRPVKIDDSGKRKRFRDFIETHLSEEDLKKEIFVQRQTDADAN